MSASPGILQSTSGRAMVVLLHALIILGGGAYAGLRYEHLQLDRQLPTPTVTPRTITPLHHRPALMTDAELARVLDRLRPRLRGRNPKINSVEHSLRLWGTQAAFDEEHCLSGAELRELLLDHRIYADAWGPKATPFVMPDTRDPAVIAFRTDAGNATSSHVDHTLACLAEIGTPLDFPVITPRGESTVGHALDLSLRQFSLNQEEYEWSALVFLHYLGDVKAWTSTEGQRITWDRIAERLMRQRLVQGVCFGQHRLYTLAALLRVDDASPLLTVEMRQKVIFHLRMATDSLVKSQHADGWWAGDWPGVERDGPNQAVDGPFGPKADRLLMTGHALEWWAYAPAEVLPPDDVLERATRWLVTEMDSLTPEQTTRFYPFLTHVGRALALWHGVEPQMIHSGK